jgi:WD40 repeat protein
MIKLNKNEDLLLIVLEFLDRNGYKQSFEKLQQKTGVNYQDNEVRIIEDLFNTRKIDELIFYINNSTKISSEEKLKIIKLLKIKKYIELILKNCSDRIDQKDSLYYLRTEISPLINTNNPLDKINLGYLTSLLFIKDMNFLTNYIKSNLGTYSDDSQIISILNKNKLIHLESIYDMNDKLSNNNRDIDFKKYDVITLTDLCFKPYKTAEIWFLEFSKNKKYLVLGFSNCNISLFTVKNNQNNNSIIINLYLTFSVNDNSKKGEITSVCFSNDEKYLLVSLSTNIIKLYNILNGEKIKEYSNLHNSLITSCIFIPNSNTMFLSGSIDRKLLVIDINSDKIPFLDIGKFVRIKQILFSESLNLIIVIPYSISDIMVYDFQKNKMSFRVELNEEIVYSNISKSDKGKYILINISKSFPKILLYNLKNTKTEDKYYGHSQKTMIIKCAFAGNKDQYIISGSEDGCVYLWDRNIPGKNIYCFKGHFGCVNSVELVFDDVIFSGSDDKSLKIWIPKYETYYEEIKKEIIYSKNENNSFKEKKQNDFEKEFFEKMNEPLEDVPNEEDNDEDSGDDE